MAKKPLFSSSLNTYLENMGCNEPPILKELRLKTEEMFHAALLSTCQTGEMLSLCIQMLGAQKVLEIGTYTGYGTLWMGLALPITSSIITLEKDKRPLELAKIFWEKANVLSKITSLVGHGPDLLTQIHGPFDFIYIDADKKAYDLYYEFSLSLIRPKGIIAIDNTLWMGEVCNDTSDDSRVKAIQHLNTKIKHDSRVQSIICPIGDGLTLALKKG